MCENHELWLFLGIFEIISEKKDRYETQLLDTYKEFFNRLIVKYDNSNSPRSICRDLKTIYNEFTVYKRSDTPINPNWQS